jgi:hypothetical protein
MEQRAVVRFLALKGPKSEQIVTELTAVYGPEALALATMKKESKRFREGRTDLLDNPRCGQFLTHDRAEAIRSVLTERPFTSCKVLYRHFRIARARCLRILHDDLRRQKFNLRWDSQTLDRNLKNEMLY